LLSYLRGPDAPLLSDTIPQALLKQADRRPDATALVIREQDIRLTWAQLAAQSGWVAQGLLDMGLLPGDRVGIWSSNCLEWILLQYACAWSGLVLVNVNPAYRAHDLSYILSKSGMRALVLRDRDSRADYRSIFNEATAGKTLPLNEARRSAGRDLLPRLPRDERL
jgi:fatty-acyl-CoA synthase